MKKEQHDNGVPLPLLLRVSAVTKRTVPLVISLKFVNTIVVPIHLTQRTHCLAPFCITTVCHATFYSILNAESSKISCMISVLLLWSHIYSNNFTATNLDKVQRFLTTCNIKSKGVFAHTMKALVLSPLTEKNYDIGNCSLWLKNQSKRNQWTVQI